MRPELTCKVHTLSLYAAAITQRVFPQLYWAAVLNNKKNQAHMNGKKIISAKLSSKINLTQSHIDIFISLQKEIYK